MPSACFISGVDFVSIPTQTLEAALEFYGSVLGLRCTGVSPRRTHAEFDAGSVTLQLVSSEAAGLEFRPNKHAVALHVDDVAAARAELEARGVAFTGETFDTGFCHNAPLEDRDGNALLLHHRYVARTAWP
jgi:catechol 2,3-dioxygenase-like lactoylglutathione lyase family enzyme